MDWIGKLDWQTGLINWTTGLVCWTTGLVNWATGLDWTGELDYWTQNFFVFSNIWMSVVRMKNV